MTIDESTGLIKPEIVVNNKITGTIVCDLDKKIYIKEYYSNGHVVYLTITDNANETCYFSGDTLKVYQDKAYNNPPNWGPLLSVREVLKCDEMSYLKYKHINVSVYNHEGDIIEERCLPPATYKFKGIVGKRVVVIDEVNDLEKEFYVLDSEKAKLIKKLKEEQKKVCEKIGTLKKVPDCCLCKKNPKSTDIRRAIANCGKFITEEYKVYNGTEKQLIYASKEIDLSEESVRGKLNGIQLSELLDYSFNKNFSYSCDEINEVKSYYRDICSV